MYVYMYVLVNAIFECQNNYDCYRPQSLYVYIFLYSAWAARIWAYPK